MEEFALAGGVANLGKVVRVGQHVLRPSTSHTRSIHDFLGALRSLGFDGASEPVGIEHDGRERLQFIEGDVPVVPYPEWARSDASLASVAVLLRRFHDASRLVDMNGASWNRELSDPEGGPVVCHNDVCLENVVFRGGIAVGLLDFEFAAPGRPIFDLANFARMCVPFEDPVAARRCGWRRTDLRRGAERLRLVCDAYQLDAVGRRELLDTIPLSIARSDEFVRGRVRAGDENVMRMMDWSGGDVRLERRDRWWQKQRSRLEAVLLA